MFYLNTRLKNIKYAILKYEVTSLYARELQEHKESTPWIVRHRANTMLKRKILRSIKSYVLQSCSNSYVYVIAKKNLVSCETKKFHCVSQLKNIASLSWHRFSLALFSFTKSGSCLKCMLFLDPKHMHVCTSFGHLLNTMRILKKWSLPAINTISCHTNTHYGTITCNILNYNDLSIFEVML